MTDIQTYIIPLMLVAAVVYAAIMFIIRKIQKGEKFDANKVLQTLGIAALAGITLYLATGAIPSLDAILTQMATMAPNDASLVAIGTVVFGIFEQYILKGKLGTTPLITPLPSTTTFEPSPAQPRGTAAILGIYGHSAAASPPMASASFDVNQIPELFFDLQTIVTGTVALSMLIDGEVLKDWAEEMVKLIKIGEKRSLAFWIPQKYRVVGNHVITIKTGYLSVAQSLASGGPDSKIVWDTSQNYGLVFTGVKASSD